MFYIYVQYDKQGQFEPHMSFNKSDKESALIELQELKAQGHRAMFGGRF